MTFFEAGIAMAGGLLAGFINTLAGNGSAITLTVLTEVLGLPPDIANGTNRIGILAQSASSSSSFYSTKKDTLVRSQWNILLMVIGAVVGAFVAINISNETFKDIFKYLLVAMLFVVLVNPNRWLRETDLNRKPTMWISVPVFLALGFYGGFIQMGMGIFFLAVMVLFARYSMTDANVVKNFVVGVYTFVVLVIFVFHGLVSWKEGLVIAVGQGTGGWLTAKFAAQHPKANTIAYWLLILVIVVAVLNLFGVFKQFF